MAFDSFKNRWNTLSSVQQLGVLVVVGLVVYAMLVSGGAGLNVGRIIAAALIVFIAFPIHEFAHAAMAVQLGDETPRAQGRYTLNPLPHIDPFGAILIFLTGFGWAKPVQWDPRNVDIDVKVASILISLAGPLSNLALAALALIINNIAGPFGGFGGNIIGFFVYINVLLFVFNLLPIPPLDGSHVLFALLPGDTGWQLRAMLGQYGFILLMLVIFLAPQVITGPTQAIMILLNSIFG